MNRLKLAGVSNVSMQAPLREGLLVLDLGCGAGLDSLVAAERVGSTGRVVGVDFSASMLDRACRSATGSAHPGRIERAAAAPMIYYEWMKTYKPLSGVYSGLATRVQSML